MILEIKMGGKYRHADDLVNKEVDEEIFIVLADRGISAEESVLFTLTDSGRLIWQLLDGTNSVQQVIEQVLQHYDAAEGEVTQDVVAFLEELAVRGMITENEVV